MKSLTIDHEVRAQAAPEAVWRVLANAQSWADWGPWDEAALEREGATEPDGVGAIRRFRRGRVVTREEVVAFEPNRQLVYELRSGLPLRDYRGEVTLSSSTNGGTELRWRSTFEPTLIGRILRPLLSRFVGDVARRVARRAETA